MIVSFASSEKPYCRIGGLASFLLLLFESNDGSGSVLGINRQLVGTCFVETLRQQHVLSLSVKPPS